MPQSGAMTGYIYDAAGIRVAKGALSSFTCDFNPSDSAYNGFQTNTSWVLGPGGEQVTEYSVASGASTWVHTNAFAGGALLATYHDTDTYFALEDWLGTKRAEVSAGGCFSYFTSMPYGNGLTPGGNCADATEHHFTGKERDSESGNDYFGARYYASSLGRWLSPDWSKSPEAVPYASLKNPQSLNLYSYVSNNPLRQRDADGHHQECAPDTMTSDGKGNYTVTAGACREVPDWWQFQGARHWLGRHHQAVKWGGRIVIGVTVVSGLVDGGASELAVPEEIALEKTLLEGGEAAAEETAAESAAEETAAETAAQPASEKQALRVAKQIEKDLGKDARRDFHDEKMKGAGDRTMQQLKEDARAVYEEHGKTPPSWLK